MSRSGLQGFDDAGFAAGSVTGVRWWSMGAMPSPGRKWAGGKQDGPQLKGAYDHWAPGENVARCMMSASRSPCKQPPVEFCGCGFWAYWEQAACPLGSPDRPVLGVVEGYGRTLIGEKGFRCEKARIVALSCQFKVEVPEEPDPSDPNCWVEFDPGSGMFRRGPQGYDTYRALGGGPARRIAIGRMREDLAALAEIETALGDRYQVPVYTSAEYMLQRHPLTTDYLPKPPATWSERIDLALRQVEAGLLTLNELRELIDQIPGLSLVYDMTPVSVPPAVTVQIGKSQLDDAVWRALKGAVRRGRGRGLGFLGQ